MAELYEVVGSFTPLTRQGNEWAGVCPIESHAEPLAVIGDRFKCFGCGAEGDALAFLRAIGDPDPEGALSNGRIWSPCLSVPQPPPPRYGLHRALERHEATVLITDHRRAAKVAEALLPSYVCCAHPDGGDRWGALEPLRGRTVLLWPSADGLDAMLRLETVITGPLACTGKLIEPQGFDLAAFTGSQDELISWAKAHVRPLHAPASPNPAAQAGAAEGTTSLASPPPAAAGPEPERGDLSPPEPSEPPTAEFPPEATTKRPRKPKRHLHAVDGNAALAPDADAESMPVEMGEDHLALEFAAKHNEDWRYTRKWAQWHHYDGDGWRPDETELVDRLALEFCRSAANWQEARSLTPDGKRKIARRSTAFNVRDASRNDRRIAAIAEQWDTDPYLLGCPGGAIDLRTGKLIAGDREAYITMRTAVAPEKGEPALWLAHLHKVLQGDEDTIGFLRRYLGMGLSGIVGEHCLVYFSGSGRNGKGITIDTMTKLVGDYGYAAPFNLLTESKSERHPTELAALRGKRLVSASEPPEGARWDDGRIRWLTGGDPINARGMRQDPFTFNPTHKLLLMGNNLPSLRSVDPAMRARFRIIEFNYFFPPEERDIHFAERLRAEWPQILNWLIEGCMEWQDCGLGMPENIQRATDDYLESESVGTFDGWLSENTDAHPDQYTKSSEAYENFRRWSEHQGGGTLSHKSFSKKLKKAGYKITKSGVMIIHGLTLKPGANL